MNLLIQSPARLVLTGEPLPSEDLFKCSYDVLIAIKKGIFVQHGQYREKKTGAFNYEDI